MGIKDYISRVRPQAGDTEPHDEKGLAGPFAGAATLGNTAGDHYWLLSEPIVASGVAKAIQGSVDGGGATIAVRLLITVPTTGSRTPFAGWGPAASWTGNYFGANQYGAANVSGVAFATYASPFPRGTAALTLVVKVKCSAVVPGDYVQVWSGAGGTGDAPDRTNENGNAQNFSNYALTHLILGNTGMTAQFFDFAVWPDELTDAECRQIAASQMAALDASAVPPAGTVTIGTITPGVTTADVAYTYSAADATGFEYRLGSGTWAAIGASPATIGGLVASTAYELQVRAINLAGAGTASAVSSFATTAAPPVPPPTFDGPVGLVAYRESGFDLSYPAGDGTVTGYEVSTDAGGSYSSVGTSLAPTIATPLPGDPSRVRVRAFNSAGTRSTAVAVAQGVLGSSVPATGEFGAAALYAWLQANPSYMGSLVHAEVTRWPSAGTLVMNPDSSGTYTPAGDGEQSADIQPRVAGVATGTPFAIILRSGSGGGDTDPPVMQGEITVSALAPDSFATSVDPATDNVGVTGYQVSQDGGTNWTEKGLTRTHNHTGLSPQTTYPIRWRARDAAGNWATPLAKDVTTQPAPIPPSGTIGRAWHFALLRRCAT